MDLLKTNRLSALLAAIIAFLFTALVVTQAPCAEKKRTRGYMGVNLQGNKLLNVNSGSAADKAGLKSGDLIVEVDGKKIESRQDLLDVLGKKYSGDKLEIKYKRGDEECVTTLTLGKRPISPVFPGLKRINKPRHYTREGAALSKDESLKAGLKWLASVQMEDGSLPASKEFGGHMCFRTAVTSLAGMAFMTDPAYNEEASRALACIMKNTHGDGYVYPGKPSFKGMWEHGFATQFLGEMLIQNRKAGKDTAELEKKFKSAVNLIIRVQNLEGGWGYRAQFDPHAEVGPAAAEIDALLVAKRAGLNITDKVISKALNSQVLLMKRPGPGTIQGEWRSFSFEANAFVLASLLGWKDRPETKAYLRKLEGVDPDVYFSRYTEQTHMKGVYWATGKHTLGLFYTALSYRRLGEPGREKFTSWLKSVAAHLAKVQNRAGAWKGWFGDSYGTAFACLILASDSDKLEIFKAADEPAIAEKEIKAPDPLKVALKGDWKIDLTCTMEPSKTREKWKGARATISSVGLKIGKTGCSAVDMAVILPDRPIGLGSKWTVPEAVVSKMFETFHPSARGYMQAEVTGRDGFTLTLDLRVLVKFGEDGASFIQTASMHGKMIVDAQAGKVLSVDLKSVTGCLRVNQGRSRYVTLNDLIFKVTGKLKVFH